MSDPTPAPDPYPGLVTQILVAILAAFLGAVAAHLSLSAREMLYGPSSRVVRYSMEEGGFGQELVDVLIAVPMGALFFARVGQLATGLIGCLLGRRLVLSRLYWWDILLLGVPLTVWLHVAYLANFE